MASSNPSNQERLISRRSPSNTMARESLRREPPATLKAQRLILVLRTALMIAGGGDAPASG